MFLVSCLLPQGQLGKQPMAGDSPSFSLLSLLAYLQEPGSPTYSAQPLAASIFIDRSRTKGEQDLQIPNLKTSAPSKIAYNIWECLWDPIDQQLKVEGSKEKPLQADRDIGTGCMHIGS